MAEKIEALYLKDGYLKEFDAEVRSIKDGKYIILDRIVYVKEISSVDISGFDVSACKGMLRGEISILD